MCADDDKQRFNYGWTNCNDTCETTMKSNCAGVQNAATNLGEVSSMHVVQIRLVTPTQKNQHLTY